jgi:uncharacterized membrane protein
VIIFSEYPKELDNSLYNIIFVTIASFLTSVFFVTDFWKKNRTLVKMLLMVSYLVSFGLFLFSLIEDIIGVAIFDINIYKLGAYLAFALALLVGFYSKYDEKLAIPKKIADDSKNKTQGTINDKHFKV